MIAIHMAPGALITAIACCLAGLAAPVAAAEVAGDLDCRRCVDQNDNAQKAITSGKLRNGAGGERKLGRDVRDRLDEIESRFDFVAVAGAAFQPARPGMVTAKTPAGVILPLHTDDVWVTAGVNLPHGMILKDMACTVRDATDPGIVTVTLRRFPVDAVAPDTPGDVVITVSSSKYVPLADPPASNDFRVIYSIAGDVDYVVVDNENYQYHLQARMTDVGADPSAMGLAGCRIRLSKYLL
jgi:hypothetical protein